MIFVSVRTIPGNGSQTAGSEPVELFCSQGTQQKGDTHEAVGHPDGERNSTIQVVYCCHESLELLEIEDGAFVRGVHGTLLDQTFNPRPFLTRQGPV